MSAEAPGRGASNGRAATANLDETLLPAVVVGLDEGTIGLPTARILAERGVPVTAIARNRSHPSCRTRVCEEIVFADTHSDDLVDTLEALGPRLNGRGVLVPCADANVLVVSRHRERLSRWYEIVLPPHDVVELMTDKDLFYEFAAARELAVPTTVELRESQDVLTAADVLRFPCILKPVQRTTLWNAHRHAKAFQIVDAQALARAFDEHRSVSPVMLAQNWVRGGDTEHYSINVYVDANGEMAVAFTTQKLRQWPARTGQGCLSVEARNDEVVEIATRLFGLVPFRGLGYVEVKRDVVSGEHVIIEPGVGRPTGRSASAEAAGVELLYTMYRDALGLPLPERRTQRYTATKWIHTRHDTQAAFRLWRGGELSLGDWWRSWHGPKRDPMFSWRDPVPFFADFARVLRRATSPDARREGPVAGTPAEGALP